MSKCGSTIMKAKEIMAMKQQRDEENKTQYTLDKMEFFQKRLLRVEDALEIERANLCMNKCHEPS